MENFESLIIARRSTRKFTERQISAEDVQKLLQAALLAPTSKNCKSWEFVAVENKDMLKQLSVSKNSGSAFLEGCTLAVIVLGDKSATDIWVEDAAIAATYMQLQAEDLGVGSCWCHIRNRSLGEMSSEQYVRDLLHIPDNFGVLCIIGFGYKDQERKPNDLARLTWEKIHIGGFQADDKQLIISH
ncbi:MAG: nitroreductase family protein [Tannerella sp.]|jgi:nitroreductase|nr:nitroreductase family protein [Tannerella sp.]